MIVELVTAAVNAAAATADFTGAKFVRGNASELDIDPKWIFPLGGLKALGALGLVAGVAGVPFVGVAAAAGLTLFFIGAVALHVHKKVFHNIAAPVVFLGLAVGSLVSQW